MPKGGKNKKIHLSHSGSGQGQGDFDYSGSQKGGNPENDTWNSRTISQNEQNEQYPTSVPVTFEHSPGYGLGQNRVTSDQNAEGDSAGGNGQKFHEDSREGYLQFKSSGQNQKNMYNKTPGLKKRDIGDLTKYPDSSVSENNTNDTSPVDVDFTSTSGGVFSDTENETIARHGIADDFNSQQKDFELLDFNNHEINNDMSGSNRRRTEDRTKVYPFEKTGGVEMQSESKGEEFDSTELIHFQKELLKAEEQRGKYQEILTDLLNKKEGLDKKVISILGVSSEGVESLNREIEEMELKITEAERDINDLRIKIAKIEQQSVLRAQERLRKAEKEKSTGGIKIEILPDGSVEGVLGRKQRIIDLLEMMIVKLHDKDGENISKDEVDKLALMTYRNWRERYLKQIGGGRAQAGAKIRQAIQSLQAGDKLVISLERDGLKLSIEKLDGVLNNDTLSADHPEDKNLKQAANW